MLRRICIVHSGLMPCDIVKLYGTMREYGHGKTEIKYNEHVTGSTFYGKKYLSRGILLSLCAALSAMRNVLLSNISARLPDSVDSFVLEAERLVYKFDQLSRNVTLPTPIYADAYF
jgi:hypothetical protein